MAPILDNQSLDFVSRSPEQTERLGERLGVLLVAGDVICLSGELGSGKTCLVRGMARGWGALERPTSPTFTLINEYRRASEDQRFYHVDGYRLSGPFEASALGLDDIFESHGVVAVEWAERIEAALPEAFLWIDLLDQGPLRRRLTFSAQGERPCALLEDFRRVAFGA